MKRASATRSIGHIVPLRSVMETEQDRSTRMTTKLSILAVALTAAARGGSAPRASAPAPAAHHAGLQIKLTSIYVDDQDKCLRFYTDVLGFAKKDDVTNGPYRWLTVTAPDDPDGGQLQLAPDGSPAAKAYQQALFAQSQPAVMFFTDDVKAEYERIKARGGEFTMPPTPVTGSTIAIVKDTCGNLVQITQLMR
jgi:predicted enzyme related to lactoylglutathione lyase